MPGCCMLDRMPRPRPRLLVLVVLLIGSVVLLFRPISEPVTRVALWNLVDQPTAEARCPAPAAGTARWDVQVGGDFRFLDKALRKSLGETCRDGCPAAVTARVDPVWIDQPHFFSGFGRMDVPVRIDRSVGPCRDAFSLTLDVTVDEGTRGSARLAELHVGQMIGGFMRNLYDGSSRWPHRR